MVFLLEDNYLIGLSRLSIYMLEKCGMYAAAFLIKFSHFLEYFSLFNGMVWMSFISSRMQVRRLVSTCCANCISPFVTLPTL